MNMRIHCNMIIEYKDVDKAQTVLRSTQVDDFAFVESKVNGNRLEAAIESTSISSFIHTLDDYLACISVAEKIVDKS